MKHIRGQDFNPVSLWHSVEVRYDSNSFPQTTWALILIDTLWFKPVFEMFSKSRKVDVLNLKKLKKTKWVGHQYIFYGFWFFFKLTNISFLCLYTFNNQFELRSIDSKESRCGLEKQIAVWPDFYTVPEADRINILPSYMLLCIEEKTSWKLNNFTLVLLVFESGFRFEFQGEKWGLRTRRRQSQLLSLRRPRRWNLPCPAWMNAASCRRVWIRMPIYKRRRSGPYQIPHRSRACRRHRRRTPGRLRQRGLVRKLKFSRWEFTGRFVWPKDECLIPLWRKCLFAVKKMNSRIKSEAVCLNGLDHQFKFPFSRKLWISLQIKKNTIEKKDFSFSKNCIRFVLGNDLWSS